MTIDPKMIVIRSIQRDSYSDFFFYELCLEFFLWCGETQNLMYSRLAQTCYTANNNFSDPKILGIRGHHLS